MEFTQKQLDQAVTDAKAEWVKTEYDPLVVERDGLLQFKPADKSEEEQAFEIKQQELWDKEVGLTLKEHGLESYAGVIKVANAEELTSTVDNLQQAVKDIKLSTGYIPKDTAKDDEYSKNEKNKNTVGMIGNKLANFFK